MLPAAAFHSITCCHARFMVPFSWQQLSETGFGWIGWIKKINLLCLFLFRVPQTKAYNRDVSDWHQVIRKYSGTLAREGHCCEEMQF